MLVLSLILEIIIGLTETLITVDESVGMRQVCAVVIDGDLERPVLVQLDLFPVTAQRKFDNGFVVSSSRYYSPSITIDALH